MLKANEPIKIFLIADGNYYPWVATTALSIIVNTNEAVDFYVLTEFSKTEDETIVRNFLTSFDNISVSFIDVHEKLKVLEGAPLCWFKSYISYARMLIPELVPFSKVICMDVDIIVDCDMKELWNIDLEEYALAASVDPLTGLPEHAQNWLKLQADHVYFNAGLMIINCDKWRTEKTVQSLIKITKELGQKIRYVDQDVLNTYFDGNNYLPFDECYNSMPYFVKNKEGYNPKCYHFAWKVKPWLCNCFKSEVFWKYAQKTPYYEWLLQGLNKSQKGLNDNLTHFLSKKNNKNKEQFQKFAVNARKRLQV